MKSKVKGLLIAQVLMGSVAFAKTYTCVSDKYPANYGSSIEISDESFDGKPTHHLQFKLNKTTAPHNVFIAEGVYDGFASVNEAHTKMLYFNWYAGSYSVYEEGKLIPKTLAFYDFEGNMQNNGTAFVGVIAYQILNGEHVKIEKNYVYKCQLQ